MLAFNLRRPAAAASPMRPKPLPLLAPELLYYAPELQAVVKLLTSYNEKFNVSAEAFRLKFIKLNVT